MPQLAQPLPRPALPASAEAERALPLLNSMQTFPATYKGGRVVELSKDIALPKDINVLVVVLKQDDEVSFQYSGAFARCSRDWKSR